MSTKTSHRRLYKKSLQLLLPLLLSACGGHESSNQSVQNQSSQLSINTTTDRNTPAPNSSITPTVAPTITPVAFYTTEDIQLSSAETTLRQASILLLGRLPTTAENTPIVTNGDQGLDESLNLLFKTDAFYQSLGKIYNDELDLTLPVDDLRLVSQNLGINWWGSDNAMRANANAAIRNAGIELVKYVAKNDKPISEILTADYMMVNPYSARTFDIYNDLGFNTPDDTNNWKPAKLVKRLVGSSYPNGVYTPGTWQDFTTGTDGSFGHSGLLTDIYWLENYPYTNTNLNRVRARMVFKQFLDFDILSITTGTRILSANDGDNPTINNPNCTVCHRILDPVASTFLQRNNQATYNPIASLKRLSLWPVGFGDKLFPLQPNGTQMGTQNPLQWLGKEMVQDPRFLQAQINIVYRGLIGKDVIRLRENMPLTEYQAFEAQQALFAHIIAQMKAENSNIKVAFRELIKSPYFRATGINNPNNLEAHPQTGSVRLLPIGVLNRKSYDLLGVYWTDNANPDLGNQRFLRYEQLYGVPKSSDNGNSSSASATNAAIQQQFAADMSCRLVPREFYEKNANMRRLLKFVDINTAPFNADGSANAVNAEKIQRSIQYLYNHLLGIELPLNHADIQKAYQLWVSTWQKGNAELASGAAASTSPCQLTNKPITKEALLATERIMDDKNYVLRSWMVVLDYLLSDPRFFYQ